MYKADMIKRYYTFIQKYATRLQVWFTCNLQ